VDIRPEQTAETGQTVPRAKRRRSWREWRGLITATVEALVSDRCSMAAAGCAFYATLALFPAISTLVSIYGLGFSPANVEQQLHFLRGLLPPPAFNLISDRVHELVTHSSGQLGFRLVVSFLITFWSAATGTKSVLSALNVAYAVEEQRSYLRFQVVTLSMTFAAMLVAVLGIAVLVFIPVLINLIGWEAHAAALIDVAAVIMLLAFVTASIAALYWIGPCRSTGQKRRRIAPGAAVATALWLIASALLRFYVANLSTFGTTYGSLAAVVGIMLWFYLTVYAVLLGAELNAGLEASPPTAAPPGPPHVTAKVP
jgi:membrane protein